MRAALPWFEDPVVFLSSVRAMEWQSESLDFEADDEASSRLFRVARGSAAGPVRLPWLDTELSFFIAINRNPGDDVAIALDYRGDAGEPAVVASDFWTEPIACLWRPVAPSFEAFAAMLGIVPT